MAYIVRNASGGVTGSGTTVTVELPAHDENDWLIIFIGTRRASYTINETSAFSWLTGATNAATTNSCGIFYKQAGASESNPTFQYTASSEQCATEVFVVRDVHATSTVVDSVATLSGTDDQFSTSQLDTTGESNTLNFVLSCSETLNRQIVYDASIKTHIIRTNANSIGISVGSWLQQEATATGPQFQARSTEKVVQYSHIAIAFRNAASGDYDAQSHPPSIPVEEIASGWGDGAKETFYGDIIDSGERLSNPKTIVPYLESADTITGATQANPVVITATAHRFLDGDAVYITGVGGMTEINDTEFTVANSTANTFELTGEDGTAHTAYTSGGSAYHATDYNTSGMSLGYQAFLQQQTEIRPFHMTFDVGSTTLRTNPLVRSFALASTKDLSDSVVTMQLRASSNNVQPYASGGHYVGIMNGDLTDGAAYIYKWGAQDAQVRPDLGFYTFAFDTGESAYETHTAGTGSLDNTAVKRILFGVWGKDNDMDVYYGYMNKVGTLPMVGASSGRKGSFEQCAIHSELTGMNTVQRQGGQTVGQFYSVHNITLGNGSTNSPLNWDSSGQSVEFPGPGNVASRFIHTQLGQAALSFSIYASSSCDISVANTVFNMGNRHNWGVNASSSTSGTYAFSGAFVIGATLNSFPDLGTGREYDGITFNTCSEPTYTSGAVFKNCVFDNTFSTQQITVTNETEWRAVTQNANTYKNHAIAILIDGDQSGTWSAGTVDITVSGNTVDVEYNGATNFTIQSAVTLSKNETGAGTLTFDTPTDDLTVTSDTAGTLLQIVTAGTQTVLDSTTGTSLVYTHSGETVRVIAQKAGYLPQRSEEIALSGDVPVSFSMAEDPVYSASHGITRVTDYNYDPAARIMTIVANQEGRDLYSAMIDDFISESDFINVPFPLAAVGPDRIDFKAVGKYDSATTVGATIDSGDITFWKGAGMEWEHDTTGNATRRYYSIKSSNTLVASSVVGFTQTNAGTPIEATLVSNKVNQVIQYYEDTNGDGSADYDYSSHLLFKGFLTGYYQARWDVINDGGATTLEPYEYTIALTQEAIAGATGDQSVTITTLTDHTGAPLSVGGKSLDYELVDPATTTAENMLSQVNYDVYNAVNTSISGTLYTSYQAFDLPDLIIEEGSNYATEAGYFEGDGLVTDRSGVYVSRASADHPGISRFQSNDLTYYTPQVLSTLNISGMPTTGANIRLQFINTTAISASSWAASTAHSVGDKVLRSTGVGTEQTAGLYMVCTTAGTSNDTEPTWDTTVGNTTADTNGTGAGDVVWTTYAILFYDQDPGAASVAPTYINGEEFATGDAYEIRFTELDGTTSFKLYQSTGVISSTGATIIVSVTADSVYASNAIDGSSTAVTNIFTANYSTDYIVLDMNLDFTHPKAFAFYCYELTTSEGMYNFWGGVTAVDAGNYLNNVDVVDIMFDETTGDFVKQEDSDTSRWYRSDGTRPYKDPTTGSGGTIGGIAMNWKNPVYTISTGSVLTAQQQSDLTKASEAQAVNTKIGTPTDTDIATDISNVQAKTDQLTFTVPNKVDSNTQYMSDSEVQGDGSEGDKWRGV